MGAAERRVLYNPLRQLRDQEQRSLSAASPGGHDAAAATAWAKADFPGLRILRGALSPNKLASLIFLERPVRKLTHPVVNKSRILRFL